eukprot:jgi/Chrzof1/14846/Cz09g18080.t1
MPSVCCELQVPQATSTSCKLCRCQAWTRLPIYTAPPTSTRAATHLASHDRQCGAWAVCHQGPSSGRPCWQYAPGRHRDSVRCCSSMHDNAAAPPTRICITPLGDSSTNQSTYSLEDTRRLVETAMLAAVSGLAYLLSTLLKLDNSIGYFLPLPIVIASMRSGIGAGWNTMLATAFLLSVLLGPLRSITYVLVHGILAACLGTLWRYQSSWGISIFLGAVIRMSGQLGYLLLSSVTMNENLFAVILSNVHGLLDQVSAAMGVSGAPSTLAIKCMIFALLLVNGLCYVFLLHVVYWFILTGMGFKVGPLPGMIRKYLYAGVPEQQQQQQQQ